MFLSNFGYKYSSNSSKHISRFWCIPNEIQKVYFLTEFNQAGTGAGTGTTLFVIRNSPLFSPWGVMLHGCVEQWFSASLLFQQDLLCLLMSNFNATQAGWRHCLAWVIYVQEICSTSFLLSSPNHDLKLLHRFALCYVFARSSGVGEPSQIFRIICLPAHPSTPKRRTCPMGSCGSLITLEIVEKWAEPKFEKIQIQDDGVLTNARSRNTQLAALRPSQLYLQGYTSKSGSSLVKM